MTDKVLNPGLGSKRAWLLFLDLGGFFGCGSLVEAITHRQGAERERHAPTMCKMLPFIHGYTSHLATGARRCKRGVNRAPLVYRNRLAHTYTPGDHTGARVGHRWGHIFLLIFPYSSPSKPLLVTGRHAKKGQKTAACMSPKKKKKGATAQRSTNSASPV